MTFLDVQKKESDEYFKYAKKVYEKACSEIIDEHPELQDELKKKIKRLVAEEKKKAEDRAAKRKIKQEEKKAKDKEETNKEKIDNFDWKKNPVIS